MLLKLVAQDSSVSPNLNDRRERDRMQFSVFSRCHARFRVNYIPSSPSPQSGAADDDATQARATRCDQDSDAQKVTGVKARGCLSFIE